MKKLWKVIKPCINQSACKRLEPGEIAELSAFDYGRLLADGSIVPYNENIIEASILEPHENNIISYVKRRGRRPRAM